MDHKREGRSGECEARSEVKENKNRMNNVQANQFLLKNIPKIHYWEGYTCSGIMKRRGRNSDRKLVVERISKHKDMPKGTATLSSFQDRVINDALQNTIYTSRKIGR